MTNLARRPPLGLKLIKPESGTAKARAHMAKVAQMPCVCCGAWPVHVHHCISGRFGQEKASDFETIPLCPKHHQHGPESIHQNKRLWEETYGLDTDYLPVVADALAGDLNSPWRR